jgi:hypothetical protein
MLWVLAMHLGNSFGRGSGNTPCLTESVPHKGGTLIMAQQVAALVKSAQEDSALRQALQSDSAQVARERNIPALVAAAAARALAMTAVGLAVCGVWF